MARIGITTTIPQEIILASGSVPVDLNNIFVSSENRESFLARAFRDGYPRTVCPWIAGIYGTILETGSVDLLIAVTQGDCSNTHALAETVEDIGFKVLPFAFPYDKNPELLRAEMEQLAQKLGARWENILKWFEKLRNVRSLCSRIDELTWRENRATGFENHFWLVSSSDFWGDAGAYEKGISRAIADIEARKALREKIRLGYIGVPPIFPDIYDDVEKMGARVVFNETQRQFSLPYPKNDFVSAYSKYTYPKSVFTRIDDIKREIARRNIHGILHYTQSFCFRQIEDLLFRRHLEIPILTIEGESSFEMDERTRVRLEAFIRMLEDRI